MENGFSASRAARPRSARMGVMGLSRDGRAGAWPSSTLY
jgi:hypothetical protein